MMALLAVLALTGCVGAVDRVDFDAEIRSRGGGVAVDWVQESLDAIAQEVGAPNVATLQVITLTITPSSFVTVVQARRSDRPDFVDTVAALDGEVISVTPRQNADELPLDEITISAEDLPLADIEVLVDDALAAFVADIGDDAVSGDAFVTLIQVSVIDSVHVVDVSVESVRRTGVVRFDVDGSLVEVMT